MSEDTAEMKSDIHFMKTMLQHHWKAAIIFMLGIIIILLEAIFVVFYWVETSDIGGNGTWTFDQWSVSNVLIFTISLAILEIIVVFIGVILLYIEFKFFWWNRLTQEERDSIHQRSELEKTHKHRGWGKGGRGQKGGGFGGFVALSSLAFIFLDGNLDTLFGALNYSYFVFTWLKAFVLMAIIWGFIYLGYGMWLVRQPD